MEGWQAWDIACKLITQSYERFPLEIAMQLSSLLGYEEQAMAELLPEVAIGTLLAIKDIENNNGSG